ncbi:MAG: pyrroloquinoline quinone-dependent dehydrogenase [Myxococcota bacterium]
MRRPAPRHLPLLCLLAGLWLLACGPGTPPVPAGGPAAGWPVYGGDPGGARYSPLDAITPESVRHLERAWEFHTGDLYDAARMGQRNHAFQATPILLGDTLYFCTPRSWVIALDASTGEERWRFDPAVDLSWGHYTLNCRGVAAFVDAAAAAGQACARRILVATADARLIALDAADGRPCAGFGDGGTVEFFHDVALRERREYSISSPPVLVRDVVVLGSSVGENRRTDMPSGKVHAFDARSGAVRWTWDPIPKDASDPAWPSWEEGSALRTGAANVWSLASADPERDLVFVPTSSPSPDWYGGERLGDNRHADSVVALRGATGEVVWSFQTVHHNLWDYDVGSQPVLVDLPRPGGGSDPALLQATKMGHLFVLHRETGEPLVPVEERPVPRTDVPGERTAKTQPFPSWPPPLAPQGLRPGDAWGFTFWDRGACRDKIASLRSEGIFTPPSTRGTVIFPGTAGGSNWGSVAYDPERHVLVANTSRIANTIRISHRDDAGRRDDLYEISTAEMQGTPYVAHFGVLLSPWGIPCNAPPWGTLTALDLAERRVLWESTLGTTADLAPFGIAIPLGTPNMGGAIVTAGGVAFIGAAMDSRLRAFDVATGEELWSDRLPAGGQATPMTYRLRDDGRQFVVIAAGGHTQMRTRLGDSLVAYALPDPR